MRRRLMVSAVDHSKHEAGLAMSPKALLADQQWKAVRRQHEQRLETCGGCVEVSWCVRSCVCWSCLMDACKIIHLLFQRQLPRKLSCQRDLVSLL